jgi:NitT/TauT family transport system substrate-binding protein
MRNLISRRGLLGGALGLAACAPKIDKNDGGFTLWGPPAGPSIILAYAEKLGMLREASPSAGVAVWRSPDELRAGLTSKTIALSIMPLNTAANLYNRGRDIRLVNIMTRGLLYVVSSDDTLNDIPALAGRRLAVPYRKDAPEIVLRQVLKHHRIDPAKDLNLQITGTPIEAAQLLITGRVDAAFIPEPAASAAISAAGLLGRTLRRTIDIQEAWKAVAGPVATLPQAGLAVSGGFAAANSEVLRRLKPILQEAAAETLRKPADAAEAAAKVFSLPKAVLEASIPYSNLTAIPAAEARAEVDRYLSSLHALDPEILGGRPPDAGFFL